MKIKFKNFYLFSVPLDFDISKIKILFSNHLIVKLTYKNITGIGEGVLYKTPLLKAKNLLQNEFKNFFKQKFVGFKEVREKLSVFNDKHPGLVCAFDLALWDLEAKISKKKLYQLFGNGLKKEIPLIEQIFIPKNKQQLKKEIKEILRHKTKIIKLKAGRNLREDLKNIQIIQKMAGGKVKVQLDLNQALNFKEAENFAFKLKRLGIKTWEEPLKFKNFNQLKNLKEKTGLKIILDESVLNYNDFKNAIKAEAVDILNIKFSRLGGISSSLKLLQLAKKNKIKTTLGCNEELGIAAAGQIHFAATFPQIELIEGLGFWRLGFDIVDKKWKVNNGRIKVDFSLFGLGVNFIFSKLQKASRKLEFTIAELNKIAGFNFYFSYYKKRIKSKIINGFLLLQNKLRKRIK